MNIKNVLIAFILGFSNLAFGAQPLQIILPYAPGGGTDVTARMFQKFLKEKKDIDSIIVYKPGAEGAVGTIDISRADNDGSFIGITAPTAIVNALDKNPDAKVEYVSLIEIPTLVLVTRANSNINTFDDVLKTNGIKFGVGSDPQKRSVEQLISLVPSSDHISVSYKGGGPVLNDLLGGHIDLAFLPASIALPLINDNQLKLIASSSPIPKKTTVLSKKYKSWVNYAGYCVVLPKNTKIDIQQYWEKLTKEYLNDSEIQKEIISNLGTIPTAGSLYLRKIVSKL